MSKKVKSKKNYIQIITIILVIVSIICMVLWGIIYAVNYAIIGEDEKLDENGNIITVSSSSKKKVINALICGKNEELTDTIIYLKYPEYSEQYDGLVSLFLTELIHVLDRKRYIHCI